MLSACFQDSRRIRDIMWLRPEHFYSGTHATIWEATLTAFATGELDAQGYPAVDVIVVGDELKRTEKIASIGGMAYLAEIFHAAPALTFASVMKYARIVAEKARVRKAIAAAQRFAAEGYLDYGTAEGYLSGGAELLAEIASTEVGRLRIRGVDQIFAPRPKELPWVCKGLRLIAGRVAIVAGYSYTGKTLLTQSLALSVISGAKVWGSFPVERRGSVGHLNWDQPELDTDLRYQRLARAMGLDPEDLRGRLEVVQYPDLDLSSPGDVATVRSFCRDKSLVIIDALISAAGEVPEGDPAIGRVLYKLNAISEETGCCILVIHHAGKGGKTVNGKKVDVEPLEQLRGSSAIGGAAGSVFVLERTGKGKPIKVTQAKTPALAGKGLEPFALRFVDVDIEGEPNAGVRVDYVHPEEIERQRTLEAPPKADKAEQARQREREKAEAAAAAWIERRKLLLETIKANPGDSGNDLARKLGGRRADVAKLLTELKSMGLAADVDGWRAV